MAVNGQPIAGRFILRETDVVHTGQEAGWAPELDWALWRVLRLFWFREIKGMGRFLPLTKMPVKTINYIL